jgi:hypothetical protein
MRSSKFTPGPWRLKTSGNLGNAIEAYCGEWRGEGRWSIVCTFQNALSDPALRTLDEENVNEAANGNLIAAAPKLYKTLEDVERVFQFIVAEYPSHLKTLRKVQAALSQARGDTQ